MKSTDIKTEIVKPEDPLRHVKQYVSKELAKYPVYQKIIEDTRAELYELRNHLALSRKPSDGTGGGFGSGVSDTVQEIMIKIDLLDDKLKQYQWRVKKTEAGLKYFEQNKEIMELINLKYFVCHDWDNEVILEKLGYSSRKKRYYTLLKKVVETFGQFYGVMMP